MILLRNLATHNDSPLALNIGRGSLASVLGLEHSVVNAKPLLINGAVGEVAAFLVLIPVFPRCVSFLGLFKGEIRGEVSDLALKGLKWARIRICEMFLPSVSPRSLRLTAKICVALRGIHNVLPAITHTRSLR